MFTLKVEDFLTQRGGRRCHHPNGQLVKGVASQQWPSGKIDPTTDVFKSTKCNCIFFGWETNPNPTVFFPLFFVETQFCRRRFNLEPNCMGEFPTSFLSGNRMVISGKSEVADQIFFCFLHLGRLFCYLFKFMKMMIREPVFKLHVFPLVYQWFKQCPTSTRSLHVLDLVSNWGRTSSQHKLLDQSKRNLTRVFF